MSNSNNVAYLGRSRKIHTVLRDLSEDYQTKIHAISGCYMRPVIQEAGTLYICMHCRKNIVTAAPPDSVYGFRLSPNTEITREIRRGVYPPGLQGEIIYSNPERYPVAEVKDGVIHILLNLEAAREYWNYPTQTDGIKHWEYNGTVLWRILRDAIPVALNQKNGHSTPSPAILDPIEQKRAILAANKNQAYLSLQAIEVLHSDKRIKQLEKQEFEILKQAANHRAEWLKLARSGEETRILINGLKKNSGQELQSVVGRILEFPDIIGFDIRNNILVFFTDTIHIEHRNRRYKIGAFEIRVNLLLGDVSFFNYTNRLLEVNYIFDHPHISNGSGCFGNISEAVYTILKEENLEMLINVLLQFLKSYDNAHPFRLIESWPAV